MFTTKRDEMNLESRDEMNLESRDEMNLESRDEMNLESRDKMNLESRDDMNLESRDKMNLDKMNLESKDKMNLESKDKMNLESKDKMNLESKDKMNLESKDKMNLESKNKMHSKILAMIINGAIGDQYGAPLEMMCSDLIREKYGDYIKEYIKHEKERPDYSYTDDTQMTIGLINYLIDNKVHTKEGMFKYFVKYFEPSRGYSSSVYKLFTEYLSLQDETKVDTLIDKKLSVSKTTNGGLMRISPVVVPCMDSSDEETLKMIELVHYPTHLNEIALHTSLIYVKFLKFLYKCDSDLSSDKLLKDIIDHINVVLIPNCLEFKNSFLEDKLKYLIKNIDANEYEILDELIGLDGVECYETLSCAVLGLIKNLSTPDKIVGKVITYGGDCDTITSIAGQMSGILFGCSAINKEWIKTLENRNMLLQISNKLVQKYLQK
jgi:ADP-ribosylglycohydrolase